jgi:hypothetical protein
MKCNQAGKLILLRDSGELAARHEGALAAHLHNCESCCRLQHALLESKSLFPAGEEPSATVLNNVKREARRCAPAAKPARIIHWKPALAMAASVVIGAGIFFSAFHPDSVGLELLMSETDLLDTPDQVVSVMYSALSEDDLAFNFLMTYDEEAEG